MEHPGNLGIRTGKLDTSSPDEITEVPKTQRSHPLQNALLVHITIGEKRKKGPQKIPFQDCNYVSPGPFPFTCGNCKFLTWGVFGDDPEAQVEETEGSPDQCQIVDGPYDGGVDPEDSCRFFRPKPAYTVEDALAEEDDGDPDEPAD